jgi:hypothetical protein
MVFLDGMILPILTRFGLPEHNRIAQLILAQNPIFAKTPGCNRWSRHDILRDRWSRLYDLRFVICAADGRGFPRHKSLIRILWLVSKLT